MQAFFCFQLPINDVPDAAARYAGAGDVCLYADRRINLSIIATTNACGW